MIAYITEAEAKTKWCPLVRVQNFLPEPGQNPAVNRPDGDMQCIASACMAWRPKHERTCSDAPKGEGWTETERKKDGSRTFITWERDVGYCGAFGRPE